MLLNYENTHVQHLEEPSHVCLCFKHGLEIIKIKIQLSVLCCLCHQLQLNQTYLAFFGRGGSNSFPCSHLDMMFYPSFIAFMFYVNGLILWILWCLASFTQYSYLWESVILSVELRIIYHASHGEWLYIVLLRTGTHWLVWYFLLWSWETSSSRMLWKRTLGSSVYRVLDAQSMCFCEAYT